MTFSIRDLESPYSYLEASESAPSSDSETLHDDHSEAPNPESSTLPQDKPIFSQDGAIEQAQGDDGESWEDGLLHAKTTLKIFTQEKAYRWKPEPQNIYDRMETVDKSSVSVEDDVPSSNSPDSQSGNPLESPQKERTKALKMAKNSTLKAKRCAKEPQKPTALEAFHQTLAKAKEEAIAPQRKKARAT